MVTFILMVDILDFSTCLFDLDCGIEHLIFAFVTSQSGQTMGQSVFQMDPSLPRV